MISKPSWREPVLHSGIGIAEEMTAPRRRTRAVTPLSRFTLARKEPFVVAGSDDLGIMEVRAKVINESVDKNAKVIFGIMRDES